MTVKAKIKRQLNGGSRGVVILIQRWCADISTYTEGHRCDLKSTIDLDSAGTMSRQLGMGTHYREDDHSDQ
jgi:hypothetical protein